MNRYNIRIDSEVMPNSYTYEELLLNDILDFDDIEVKQVSKSNWTNIKSFYFPEEHEEDKSITQDFYVDESGQAHFMGNQSKKKESEPEYVINEFGEMVRRGDNFSNVNSSANRNGSSSSTGSSPSSFSSSSSSSSDFDGWKILKIIITVIIVGFVIAVIAVDGWGAISIPPVAWILNKMWNDN